MLNYLNGRWKLVPAAGAVVAFAMTAATSGFEKKYHKQMTEDALTQFRLPVGDRVFRFSPEAIQEVVDANVGQDGWTETNCALGTNVGPSAVPAFHVTDDTHPAATLHLATQKKIIRAILERDASLFGDPCAGATARKVLGEALHALQDFYAHSNWIETHGSLPAPNLGEDNHYIPLDRTVRYCAEGGFPRTIFDRRGITTGYWSGNCGDGDVFGGRCRHGRVYLSDIPGIAKDSPDFDRFGAPGDFANASLAAQLATIAYINLIAETLIDANNTVGLASLTGSTGSLSFVVNVTGCLNCDPEFTIGPTMEVELPQIRQAIRTTVMASVNAPELQPAQYILTEFGSNLPPNILISTAIPSEFLAKVDLLVPKTTAPLDCGLLACGAVMSTLEEACEGGKLHLFTDHGTRDRYRAGGVAAVARKKHIEIHPKLSGTCSPIDPAFVKMAEGSGGTLRLFEEAHIGRAAGAMVWDLFRDVQLLDQRRLAPDGSQRMWTFVDPSVTSLRYSVQLSPGSAFTIYRPDGTPLRPEDPDVSWISSATTAIVTVDHPTPLSWGIVLAGSGEAWFTVEGRSPYGVRDFSATDQPGGPHPAYFENGSSLRTNIPSLVRLETVGPWARPLVLQFTGSSGQPGSILLPIQTEFTARDEFVFEGGTQSDSTRATFFGEADPGWGAQRMSRQSLDVAPFSLTLSQRASGFAGPCSETSVTVRLDGPPGQYRLDGDGAGLSVSSLTPGEVTLTSDQPSALAVANFRVTPSNSAAAHKPWLVVSATEAAAPARSTTLAIPVHVHAPQAGAKWVATRTCPSYLDLSRLLPRPSFDGLVLFSSTLNGSFVAANGVALLPQEAYSVRRGVIERDQTLCRALSSLSLFPPMVYDSVRDRIIQVNANGHRVFDGHSWTDEAIAGIPPLSSATRLAFDGSRNVIVAFGGPASPPGTFSDATREFSNGQWTVREPAHRPPGRDGALLAYEPIRRRVVMLGGRGATTLRDTWEWDGNDWTLANMDGPVPTGPMLFLGHNGIRVALLGAKSFLNPNEPSRIWTWNGTQWAPDDRFGVMPAPIVDAARDPLLGLSTVGISSSGEVWVLGGGGWIRARGSNPVAHPAGPVTTACFDRAIGKVVLQCDSLTSERVLDGWTWFMDSPDYRAHIKTAIVFDSVRNRTVLFGGGAQYSGSVLNDTWERIESSWRQVSPLMSPPGRSRHAMAFDHARARTVLFGGWSGSPTPPPLGDTWLFDGTSWTPVAAPGPTARRDHAMAYDPYRQRIVLFGGTGRVGAVDTLLGDTWEWDGSAWTQVASVGPSPRARHAMAYDPTRGRVVLFGGGDSANRYSGGTPLADTWEWDGSAWTLQARGGLGGRYDHALVFDESRGRLLLVGGLGEYDMMDEYEWVPNDGALTITPGETDVRVGKAIVMGVDVPIEVPGITYRWIRDGQTLHDSPSISGATTAFLSVQPADLIDGGVYQCERTTGCGTVRSDSVRIRVLCPADLDDGSGTGLPDEGVTIEDLLYFIDQYASGTPAADLDDGSNSGNPDGGVTIDDLLYFLERYAAGC